MRAQSPAPLDPVDAELGLLDQALAAPVAIRGSLLRSGGYVLGVLVGVATTAILFRALGVTDFGKYVTVISLIAVVQGLTDAGLSAVGVRDWVGDERVARDRSFRTLLGVRIGLTVLGVAIAFGFAVAAGYGGTLVAGTALGGAGLLFAVLQGTLSISLVGRLRLGWVTVLGLLRSVLSLGIVAILALTGASLLAFLAVSIPVSLVLLAATARLVRGTVPLRPSFDVRRWIRMMRPILPFALAVTLTTLTFRLTVIASSLLASGTETGYFATAHRVLESIFVLPDVLVGSMLPILSRAASSDRARLQADMSWLLHAMVVVGGWIGISTLVGAPFIVELLTGERAEPAVTALQILAPACALVFLNTAWHYGLLALHGHRSLLVASVVALLLTLGLCVALIPRLESEGAALAAVCSEAVVAVVGVYLLTRAQPGLRVPRGVLWRVFLAAALAVMVIWLPGVDSLAQIAIGTALYFGTIYVLGAVPPGLGAILPTRGSSA